MVGSGSRTPLFPDGLADAFPVGFPDHGNAPSSDPNHAEVPSACVWVKTGRQDSAHPTFY